MGTNYYAESRVHGIPIRLHIGKSSAGWKFLFAEYDNLKSKAEWYAYLARPGVTIVDEYDDRLSFLDLRGSINSAQRPDFLDAYNAPDSSYGFPRSERDRYERLDAEGYHFSIGNPESWS